MAKATGLHFTLTLPDTEGLAVIEFTHRERLSAPFKLTVRFASRNGSLSARDILDREATLTIWQDDEMLRQVTGIVSEFARGDRGHRHSFYRIEIRPALWRLGLRQNSRIFQEVSPLTVLNTLCDEHGLTDLAFAATREPEPREYLTQYREDDLAFVERLAAEEGLFYFHEFFETGGETPSAAHRLVFADAPQVLSHLGERTYHGRAGGTPPARHVRKLQQHTRVAPASATLKDYSFKKPAYGQLHDHAARDLEAHGQRSDYEHYDYPGRYKADASGQAFTRIRLEALRRGANTADAESDLPELAPGTRFTLTDHDLEDLNRDWQVLGVVHHGKQPQALEEDGFVQGSEQTDQSDGLQDRAGSEAMTRYHNELVLMPAEQAWRPEPNPRPRVDGPQIAFVVGPEGEEIHCDEHGRVKVQFPWDRYAEPNETASAWLRVSQDWAGGGYGSMAIPRIGHEVLVSYLEGDPDQPLITGRIYNAVSTPPYELPAHKTRTVIRTQSHQGEGFNELRFDDEAGQEQIWLHAQKDLELLTHNDRTEEIGHDSHLTVHRHRISEIHADDHLTVRGQRHLKVDGDDHLIVGATRHEKTARAQLVEAGQEIHHQAGSKTVIDAGAEITLKAGGSFLKLDPSGITIVGAQVKINSGGSPGSGSGQGAAAALLPGAATPEASEDVTLKSVGAGLFSQLGNLLDLGNPAMLEGLANRCSACAPAVGSPVNPLLGAKLLPAETDFALPAPRPFVFSRGYLSANARIGVLGQGWSVPGDGLSLTLRDDACVIHDAQGRDITFGALAPGQSRYSPTEQLWLRRGGEPTELEAGKDGESARWAALPEALRHDPQTIVLSDDDLYYVFAPTQEASSTWRLAQELDRNGYATTYRWEAELLVQVEDSAGRHFHFDYEALLPASEQDSGQRLSGVRLVREADGSTQDDWLVRYAYSPEGDLISVQLRHGEVVREFEWQDHMLTAHRVPGGIEARYTWDRHVPEGRVIAQEESGGLTRTYAYHPDHTLVTDSLGREERYHFSGSGPGQRWTAHTRADGSVIQYRYDHAGQRIATIDPLGRETALERDESGQVIAQIGPDGSRWAITRDAQGQPIAVSGPENHRWQFERDVRGNLIRVTGPEGTTTFAFESEALPDRPTAVTDAGGSTRRLEWNALGQLVAETDCSAQTTRYDYDSRGYLLAVTNALGETTRTTHDEMGRRIATQLPDGSRWQHHHDLQGRLVEQEGPQGYRQQFHYDAHGRPVLRIDADGGREHYAYDEAGRLSELTLANGAGYHFEYDEMDRLVSETGPDGREQRYTYDAAGQLSSRAEAHRLGPDGQPLAVHYEFDANGRLIARHLPATDSAPASTERYQWRADGQLSGVVNPESEVSFAYDTAGRPIGERQRHHADGDVAAWQWQHQQRLTATGAPQASRYGDLPELAWHTYGSGHLHGLSAPGLGLELALEPDALHRETQRRLSSADQPQPLILERGYTALGQLDHLSLRGPGSAKGEQHYRYDALGRLSFRSQGSASPVIAYSYDAAGRLIASQHGDRAHRYPVDAAGNRLEGQASAQPDNRLTQLDGARYRHDGAGNLIERETSNGERLSLGYDGANRLVRLTRTSAQGVTEEARYRYDALGRRISKTVHHANGTTATTHYGWDGDRLVHEEKERHQTTVVYEPGSFVPMLRIDQAGDGAAKQISAFVTDALGTPMQLVTPRGDTLWQAQPDDWAAVANEQGRTTQPIRFQGQWHDEESGLYYNRHRYYDPQQGRYINQDPIGLNGGTNLYGYVSNPTGMVDPLGLSGQIRLLVGAEKIRGEAWCAAQYLAAASSVSQLPAIVEQHIEMADEARSSRVDGCGQKKRNQLIYGSPADVAEGGYNACLDRAERGYQERLLEIAREDVTRRAGVDDQLNEIFQRCLDPSVGDLEVPRGRR